MKRMYFMIAAAVLLCAEILIGQYGTGWVRGELGDVIVIPLVYTLVRAVSPRCPRYGWVLPTCVLVFAFAVELAQLADIAEKLGIENELLRTVIGTSFSSADLLCYAIGAVPLYAFEAAVRRQER